jgi:hypothetical protein
VKQGREALWSRVRVTVLYVHVEVDVALYSRMYLVPFDVSGHPASKARKSSFTQQLIQLHEDTRYCSLASSEMEDLPL